MTTPTIGRRRTWILSVLAIAALAATATACSGSDQPAARRGDAAAERTGVVYRTPTCGCCKEYEAYLRRHGFEVTSVVVDDLTDLRSQRSVPGTVASCHTTDLGGYTVEGHVPVEAIETLLNTHPSIDGVTVPGMPPHAPGMGPQNGRPIEVLSFNGGSVAPFMTL